MTRVRAQLRTIWRSEEGSTLPLLVGAAGLALVLALVVAAASALYLEHKRLLALADAAARVGAEAFAVEDVTPRGDGTLAVRLRPARVETAVEEFLRAHPVGEFDDLRLIRATSADGRSAMVEVSAHWRPPVLTLVLPDGLRIEAVATARTVLHSASIH